jgi:hypothetical protein
MAEKYAGKKFDDADPKVDASVMKTNDAFPKEGWRRAIQGITNRVLGGTAGTGRLAVTAGCAVGSTVGFIFASDVGVVRNGVASTCAIPAATGLYFGKLGTMGTNTVAKFLIATVDGTSGTVIGPGNIIHKEDYSTVALAAAAAKLPDLPDTGVALGYVTLNAPASTVLVLTDGATTTAASLGYKIGTGGTAGTAAYVDLMNMPLDL